MLCFAAVALLVLRAADCYQLRVDKDNPLVSILSVGLTYQQVEQAFYEDSGNARLPTWLFDAAGHGEHRAAPGGCLGGGALDSKAS